MHFIFRRNIFYFGQISWIFVCAKVFILAKIVHFSENRGNIHIFAKIIKVVLKIPLSILPRIYYLLSSAYFCENFRKTDIFAKIYVRQEKYTRKQTLSRKSANISCRPKIFSELVPLSHLLLTNFAFFVKKLNQH
jgi:hypothetical protein